MKKYYDNAKDNAAFDRCIDVMAKLIQRYGPQVLKQQERKNYRSNILRKLRKKIWIYTLRIYWRYAIISTQRVFFCLWRKEKWIAEAKSENCGKVPA